ncbi:aminopeptidase [Halocatena halophila]|uniref:aminopeptidase n=1 Tax=Halocatena halophila TaxID=2814576 RepID=UPI002ED0D13A
MDDRVRRHAELLVDHCLEVTADDDVLVIGSQNATPLVTALYGVLGERGATPMGQLHDERARRAYQKAVDPENVSTSAPRLAAMEAADAVVLISSTTNPYETMGVSDAVKTEIDDAHRPILDARLDNRWVITVHPTAGGAYRARMGTDAYRSFVYDAVDVDWEHQRRRQQRVADIIDAGETIRIQCGRTDLTMSIADRTALNDDATRNMPGGEVATSPVVESVEGTAQFDLPFFYRGDRIEDVTLTFEDGVVVDCAAGDAQDAMDRLLERDAGARRLGELGIGMNRGIDRATTNTLFDEKMAGTVHLALGFGFTECLPDDQKPNQSDIHTDMLIDLRSDSLLTIDGDPIIEDGNFWFEGE